MPKYCVRNDGAVYPYSDDLAKDARFKVVDELPTAHLKSIESAKGRTDERLEAAKRMRKLQDQRLAAKRAHSEEVRARLAEEPTVDAAASADAQSQVNYFTGNAEPGPDVDPASEVTAPAVDPEPFVIGTAEKPALIAYAKANFNVTIAKNMGLEKMRLKVAELAGVQAS